MRPIRNQTVSHRQHLGIWHFAAPRKLGELQKWWAWEARSEHATPSPSPPPSECSDGVFSECVFHTPICIVLPSHCSLKFCAFEWLQSSSSWEVAVFNRVSPPKIPPTPLLGSPQLGSPPPSSGVGQCHTVKRGPFCQMVLFFWPFFLSREMDSELQNDVARRSPRDPVDVSRSGRAGQRPPECWPDCLGWERGGGGGHRQGKSSWAPIIWYSIRRLVLPNL